MSPFRDASAIVAWWSHMGARLLLVSNASEMAAHVVYHGLPVEAIKRFFVDLSGNCWDRALTPEEATELRGAVGALRGAST